MTKRYKGEFSWYGETFTLFTTTKDEDHAFVNFIGKLVKKVGYSYPYVYGYFLEKNRYRITKI